MTPRPAVICFAGPRDRYQSALALQENHALEALVTEAYFGKFWAETGLAGQNFHRFAKARHHPDIPATKAVRSPGAFVRTLRARFDRRKDSPHLAIADRLLGEKAGQVALRRRAPLIGYSYYAAAAFRMMAGSGLPRILFQVHPNGKYLRELFRQEIEKVPEARASLMEEAEMSPLFAANDEACAMADAVICASTFTRSSLAAAGSVAPAHVVGYGVDLDVFTARSAAPSAKPLTVGFVGALSQRKGARYLLGALAALPKGAARLILYTRAAIDRDLIRGFASVDVELRSGLSDTALAADIRRCDLVALPSIAEGFGLVILEAMACGVPVLCTTSTGGADFIRHRRNGLLIEPGSVAAIEQELAWALTHRDELFQLGQAARAEAEKHTWAEYRRKFFAAYANVIG
ncbi:sulfoquinovosyl transferase SQD2 [Opitutia bacterium]|nr:sulfoquinovosyl transferase SQD2 [Opitutae bacterium]